MSEERVRRRPRRAPIGVQQAPWRTLRNPYRPIEILSADEIETIHRASLRILDDSLRSDREAIFVIHGHGTGALRNAVRQHLKPHPAATQRRPGEPGEGGDGVTIAWLS